VFRLALRQTEGLIGSILALFGLDLAVPDHSTLSRRAETLAVPQPKAGSEPVHLLVDSTGLRPGLLIPTEVARANGWRRNTASSGAGRGRDSTSPRTPTLATSSPRY
jgi:hypothetical protein